MLSIGLPPESGIVDQRPGEGEARGAGRVAGVRAAGIELGAAGVAGRDQLVGAAVGQEVSLGLLADVFVRAGGG